MIAVADRHRPGVLGHLALGLRAVGLADRGRRPVLGGRFLEDVDHLLDRSPLGFRQPPGHETIAATDRTAKQTITQLSPIPFFQAGNASISA